jgi:protoporphyrinogen IX oxidase
MLYLLFKSLHIIGFTAWFAGLFYLGRIFVYHKEALEQDKDAEQYHLMEVRAYHIICYPALVITWVCGMYMLISNGWGWLEANPWMHIKLVLLALLTAYHINMRNTIAKLHTAHTHISSFNFRLLNEVPTLFLFSIVLLAVFRNGLNTLYAFLGILSLGMLLYLATKYYKSYRQNKQT